MALYLPIEKSAFRLVCFHSRVYFGRHAEVVVHGAGDISYPESLFAVMVLIRSDDRGWHSEVS